MSQTVAIIGASADRRKFGNKSVRAHLQRGFTVFPIHPTASEIEGCTTYRSICDLPVDRLDRVSLYVPPHVGLALLDDLAVRPPNELWVNPGAESDELLEKAKRLGLPTIVGCSIVAIGISPTELD